MGTTSARRRPARVLAAAATGALVAALGGVGAAGSAGAATLGFTLTPSAGPAGTTTTASGTGCSPGLVRTAALDKVTVNVFPALLTVDAPVAADGSWRVDLTIAGLALP